MLLAGYLTEVNIPTTNGKSYTVLKTVDEAILVDTEIGFRESKNSIQKRKSTSTIVNSQPKRNRMADADDFFKNLNDDELNNVEFLSSPESSPESPTKGDVCTLNAIEDGAIEIMSVYIARKYPIVYQEIDIKSNKIIGKTEENFFFPLKSNNKCSFVFFYRL